MNWYNAKPERAEIVVNFCHACQNSKHIFNSVECQEHCMEKVYEIAMNAKIIIITLKNITA